MTELPRRLDELAAAWREPAAWEGMTEAGGVTMPAAAMGTVALDELVLHGWDLARATGQEFRCDPASTAAVLDFTTEYGQAGERGRPGGPVRPGGAGAGGRAAAAPGARPGRPRPGLDTRVRLTEGQPAADPAWTSASG